MSERKILVTLTVPVGFVKPADIESAGIAECLNDLGYEDGRHAFGVELLGHSLEGFVRGAIAEAVYARCRKLYGAEMTPDGEGGRIQRAMLEAAKIKTDCYIQEDELKFTVTDVVDE